MFRTLLYFVCLFFALLSAMTTARAGEIQMLPPVKYLDATATGGTPCDSSSSGLLQWDGTGPITCINSFVGDKGGNLSVGAKGPGWPYAWAWPSPVGKPRLFINSTGAYNGGGVGDLAIASASNNFVSMYMGANPTGTGDNPGSGACCGYGYIQGEYWTAGWNPVVINPAGGSVYLGSSTVSTSVHITGYMPGFNWMAFIDNKAYHDGGEGLAITAGDSGSTTNYIGFYDGDGGGHGGIIKTGAGLAYMDTSDARIKENITDSNIGLAELMRLHVKQFSLKADPKHTRVTGFIAQDMEKAYPDAVQTNGDDGVVPLGKEAKPWMLDYGRVTPLIVNAVKDLKAINDNQAAEAKKQAAEIEALRQALEAQEQKIKELEARLK